MKEGNYIKNYRRSLTQYFVITYKGNESEKVYISDSPLFTPEINTTLQINHILILKINNLENDKIHFKSLLLNSNLNI